MLGNHDFDYAFDNLLSLAERAEYAMLSANTYWKDGTYPEQFAPYIVKEVGGLNVAIVGLTDDGSKATTHYSNTQDIDFHDHWEVGQQVVDQANEEADLVIMLAHLHGANNDGTHPYRRHRHGGRRRKRHLWPPLNIEALW